MSDQFNQDPENDLPDWLKELRNRGSFNADEKPKDEIPKEDERNQDDRQLDSSRKIESAIPLPEKEAEEDLPSAEEPDWLKEIRERHQQDVENTEISEPSAEQAIEDNESLDDELPEIESSQWAAPLDESGQTPILEVPIQPSATDESEDPISQDSEKSISLENELGEESTDMADEIFENLDEGHEGVADDSSTEETESRETPSAKDELADLIDSIAEAESASEDEQLSEEMDAEDELPLAEDELSLDDEERAETIESSDSEEDDLIHAEDEPSDLIDDLAKAESDSETEQFSEEMNQEDESSSADAELSLDDEDIAETKESPDSQEEIPPESELEDEISSDEAEDQDELLSWLEKVEEEDENEKESSAPIQPSSEERDLSPAELPSWLAALKPEEDQLDPLIQKADEETDPALAYEKETQGDTQELGPLAGLAGIIPNEPEVLQQARAKIRTGKLEFNTNQQQHVANLERVLAKEGAPIEDRSKRIALPMRILQLLFASLLFIATLFPLISGSNIASRPVMGSIPESTSFYNQIELLPANVPVLVAFDVQPALYGEMKPLVSTVLGHFLEKEAHLIFISTQPTGPALIERLLSEELSDTPSVVSGDYVNLGYLSGGTAALRYFASNPREATLLPQLWDSAGMENISSITDFGIVLTIASDAEDARAWIEQVSPFTSDGIFALSSAQAAPLLLPYLSTDPVTIRSLVAGLKGAAYYESLRGIDGVGRSYWDAYSFGLGSIVVLIILGGLYGRLIQLRPEDDASSKEAKKSDE